MTTKKVKVPYIDRALNGVMFWERNPKGEVGIEVEVEGGPWPEAAITNWITHADGSLRNGGIEYIIRQPVARDRVRGALDTLEASLAKSTKVFSYRTSVHVHINIQDMTVRQWVNYVALFCIFEELLVNVVGPERAGNKFCLRFKDADDSLRAVRSGIMENDLSNYLAGDLKYASCNLRATVTHGTLEFRAMRGNLEPAFIDNWTQLLLKLKDAAKEAKSPQAFIEEMSQLGPRDFAIKYLPAGNPITFSVLRQDDILNNSMYNVARLAQDIAYCLEWGEPQQDVGPSTKAVPVEVEPEIDPFAPAPMPDIRWAPRGPDLAMQAWAEQVLARPAAVAPAPQPARQRPARRQFVDPFE